MLGANTQAYFAVVLVMKKKCFKKYCHIVIFLIYVTDALCTRKNMLGANTLAYIAI